MGLHLWGESPWRRRWFIRNPKGSDRLKAGCVVALNRLQTMPHLISSFFAYPGLAYATTTGFNLLTYLASDKNCCREYRNGAGSSILPALWSSSVVPPARRR